MRTGCIYNITCKANGRVYVGSTIRKPRQRHLEHICLLRKGNHHCKYLQHAFNKYGESSLLFEVVETGIDANFVLAREQFHIWRNADRILNFSPVSDAILAAKAANTGRIHTEKEKLKRIESIKLHYELNGGRVWSEEDKLKHSIRLTGRKMPPVSLQTRENISIANKGRNPPRSAITKSIESRTAFISLELPLWLDMVSSGMSYRAIERATGRCRKVIKRECENYLKAS